MSSIPTAQEILSGTISLKPLHYDAEGLRAILEMFNDIPVSEASAKTMAELSRHLDDPVWSKAHNATHKALHEALEWAKQAGPELAQDAQTLEGFTQAQLPNASSLKAISHPELLTRLEPVGEYLQQWNSKLLPWMELTPRRLGSKPKITLAAHRAAHTPPAPHELRVIGLGPHTPNAPSKPRLFTPLTPHVHGPHCNHGHHDHPEHGVVKPHVHGESCAHVHGPKGFKAALPNGKDLRNTLIGGAIAGASAVFLNFLGSQGGEKEKQAEKSKTDKERAGDIAYTINHAISCGTTDVVLQPVIAAAFGINVGCNDPSHRKPGQKFSLRSFAHEAGHYLKGEIIGDFVAVPLTIGVQRLFPNFMHGVRKIVEPLTGWAFRLGAEHSAKRWGVQQGLSEDSPEVKARADAVYEHEVKHLPQAVTWNLFAYPIGAFGQKAMGHGSGYKEIFKSKLVGAAVSNGILIGSRMLAPGAAQRWDRFAGDNFIMPVSKKVGKLFGVDEKTMEQARAHDSWQDRLAHNPVQSEQSAKAI